VDVPPEVEASPVAAVAEAAAVVGAGRDRQTALIKAPTFLTKEKILSRLRSWLKDLLRQGNHGG